jgi:glucose/arabinose dehydrogenase
MMQDRESKASVAGTAVRIATRRRICHAMTMLLLLLLRGWKGRSCGLWVVVLLLARTAVPVASQESSGGDRQQSVCAAPPAGVVADRGLCVEIIRDALVVEESRPRGLAVRNGELFVLERAGGFNDWATLTGYVVVYDVVAAPSNTTDTTRSVKVNTTATILASAVGLTHGLAVSDAYIYATTSEAVYRWEYTKGRRDNLGEPELIVQNIPTIANQSLHTRSVLVTDELLYVSIGAEQNVDPDLGRAAIVTFPLSSQNTTTTFPFNWTDGTVIATGLRNAVGLALDGSGRLWAVDTSADEKYRADLGGDISRDNPADELNRIDPPFGRTFGFPFCWTEYRLPPTFSNGRGSQWAWHDPDIFPEPKSDEYCRDPDNNVPPESVFPAHSAPLGLTFYKYQDSWPEECPDGVAFPRDWDGHAFVAYHGSYTDDNPVPGQVVRIPISVSGTVIGGMAAPPASILRDAGPSLSGIRPVDLKFDLCGRLLVSSDGRPVSQEGRMVLRIQSDPSFGTDGGTASSGPSPRIIIVVVVIGMVIVVAISIGFAALGRQGRNVAPSSSTIEAATATPAAVRAGEVEMN